MEEEEGAGKRGKATTVVCQSELWRDGNERTGAGRTVGVAPTVLDAL